MSRMALMPAIAAVLIAAAILFFQTKSALAACQQTPNCKVGEKCEEDACRLIPIGTECTDNSQCGQSRVCLNDKCAAPESANTAAPVGNIEYQLGLPTAKDMPSLPQLNVPLPGFTFGEDSGSLLAQYIYAAYRYLISVSAIAATVMFVYGAFLYLVGTAITQIKSGKRIMLDAIIGLLLVLGSNLILRTINQATLRFERLNIAPVAVLTPPTQAELTAPAPPLGPVTPGSPKAGHGSSPGCDAKGKQLLAIPFDFAPKLSTPNKWLSGVGKILVSPGAIDCPGAYPFIYFFHGNAPSGPRDLDKTNGALYSLRGVLNRIFPAARNLPDFYPVIMVVPTSKGESETLFDGLKFNELRDAAVAALQANPQTKGVTISSESVMGHSGAGCNANLWGKEVAEQNLYMIGYADMCMGRNEYDFKHQPEKIIADISVMKNGNWPGFLKAHEMELKAGNKCRLKYPVARVSQCAEHPTKDWFFFLDEEKNHGFGITLNLIFALQNWFKK